MNFNELVEMIERMQGRVHLGGALSGRDIEAVNKTVSGMLKLLFPDPEMAAMTRLRFAFVNTSGIAFPGAN